MSIINKRRLRLIRLSLFNFNMLTVALPVGVVPMISVKSSFQVKCSLHFCLRGLNSGDGSFVFLPEQGAAYQHFPAAQAQHVEQDDGDCQQPADKSEGGQKGHEQPSKLEGLKALTQRRKDAKTQRKEFIDCLLHDVCRFSRYVHRN